MAHFAKIDENNIVLEVIVVSNEVLNNLPFPDSEALGISFLTTWSNGYTNWKQTSYNNNFRKNFAGIGFKYYPNLDGFVAPSPFPSWVLNTTTCVFEAPIPYPQDGNEYYWNETTQQWILY